MTRVLVTGGSGFIGQHLVSALAARNQQVRVLDLLPPTHLLPDVQYIEGSVLDPDLVDEALRDVGEVYHLAALPGMWLPKKDDFHTVNFHGTEVVITAARKRGIARFLHCSTESILFVIAITGYLRARPAATPGHAGPVYALETARGAACHASRVVRFSVGRRHTDDANRAA